MVRPLQGCILVLDLEYTSSVRVKEEHVYGGENDEQKRNNHIHKSQKEQQFRGFGHGFCRRGQGGRTCGGADYPAG